MPAFLIDECVSFQTVRLFKALGFHVKTVHDITLRGKTDSEVFKVAQLFFQIWRLNQVEKRLNGLATAQTLVCMLIHNKTNRLKTAKELSVSIS